METDHLLSKLRALDQIADPQWLQALEKRKAEEVDFHDHDRDRLRQETIHSTDYKKSYGNRKYYDGVELSRRYTDEWIARNAKNGIFLDYACGNGGYAIKAAEGGARLAVGIDISSVSIENARKDAARRGFSNIYFLQADVEQTRLPDRSIDAIVCSGVLHHLDLSYAFPEMRRILKPGGKVLAIEALSYNPAIRLYRRLTPGMRTQWEKEHILSMKDVRFARHFFDTGEIRFWHITSVLAPYMKSALPLLNRVDGVLTKVPGVKYLAWIFTFELLQKRND